MHHQPGKPEITQRQALHARLFDLHRSVDMPDLDAPKPQPRTRSEDLMAFQKIALDSLGAQPLKPVATTNFSEESERLEGGLKFTTLVKRCLRIC